MQGKKSKHAENSSFSHIKNGTDYHTYQLVLSSEWVIQQATTYQTDILGRASRQGLVRKKSGYCIGRRLHHWTNGDDAGLRGDCGVQRGY